MDGYERLAEHVRARMDELGLTLASIHERSRAIDEVGKGVSERTVSNMRSGTEHNYEVRSRRLVERVLHWGQGTIDGLIEGTIEEPTAEQVDELTLAQIAKEVRDLRDVVDRIVDALTAGLSRTVA